MDSKVASLRGRTDVRRHQESARHAKLALRRRVGWSSVLRFAILAKVGDLMLAFVIIPISNAASERAFSMVRKIETDFQLLLSEEVDYECEYKLIQLFSTNMFSAEHVRPSIIYV